MKIIEDIKELTINRKKWYRGWGSENSCLLNPQSGKMCCLGFYALQSGLSKKDIKNMPTPGAVRKLLRGDEVYLNDGNTISQPAKPIQWNTKLMQRNRDLHTRTGDNLIDVNDNDSISDEEREKKITSLFKRIGVAVKFIG
jgi:hypothetical protein